MQLLSVALLLGEGKSRYENTQESVKNKYCFQCCPLSIASNRILLLTFASSKKVCQVLHDYFLCRFHPGCARSTLKKPLSLPQTRKSFLTS